MEIVVVGKIVDMLEAKTGISKNNKTWMAQDFVIEAENGGTICFNVFGEDAIKESGLRLGANVVVVLDIVSQKWRDNNKYYTNIKMKQCYVPASNSHTNHVAATSTVRANEPQPTTSAPAPQPQPQPAQQPKQNVSADDLPF